ncbi:ROK family protein [Streptomyces bohaiensis]|uniref:ROK family protein n=1 Tax=Streptomyces bohaiensis TaxID=1431344 RepID=UPI003B7EFBB4
MTPARTATPRTARAINDRIALDLLVEHGPLTATQLRDATGLSRPSVADLVGRLQEDGLVTVVGESGSARRGPNARLYGLVAERAHVAALDVRLDSATAVVADLSGRTVARTALPVPSPREADAATAAAVLEALDAALARVAVTELHTVVVGAPGLVDPATGALNRAGIGLPAWHAELVRGLPARTGARVRVENEVNLAAIAELRGGAARDRDTFVLLWLGAGTGAAVVLDGALRRGASGGAGEIGFLPVPGTDALPAHDDCGGGLHALTSAAAVLALAAEHGVPAPAGDDTTAAAAVVRLACEAAGDTATTESAGNAADTAGAPDPARADAASTGPAGAASRPSAAGGTPPALAAEVFLTALAERIALAAAAVAAVLDPGRVVLGGETGRAGGAGLARRVERRLRTLSPLPTEVRAARSGGGAVLSGALPTALDAARDDLFAPDLPPPG